MVAMNLTELKAQAEAARADSVELELWRESIEVDEYLRLVEVARAACKIPPVQRSLEMDKALEGIEP